uniref:Predicted protein n=1 Tax=Hordeum vulgare subsp. vulgare TaxID=112509 RepID=F2CVT6_HORVV|nr:predicted protein [Hordeum vulgare subsp. vulgare]
MPLRWPRRRARRSRRWRPTRAPRPTPSGTSACILLPDFIQMRIPKQKKNLEYVQQGRARIGYPTVSCNGVMGMTPARLVNPNVGLMPTTELNDDGQSMEPSVSVPSVTAAMLAAAATPEPALDPHGVDDSTYGFRAWPPRALHPASTCRKLAHSDRLAFPSTTAPARRSRATTPASRLTTEPRRAKEPAVVLSASRVAMLSLSRTGTPCSEPVAWPEERRSASARLACRSASGFTSMTACRSGLRRPIWSR